MVSAMTASKNTKRRRSSILSAMAPPKREREIAGIASISPTMPSMTSDLVSSQISHPHVTMAIWKPETETTWPIQ